MDQEKIEAFIDGTLFIVCVIGGTLFAGFLAVALVHFIFKFW